MRLELNDTCYFVPEGMAFFFFFEDNINIISKEKFVLNECFSILYNSRRFKKCQWQYGLFNNNCGTLKLPGQTM